CWRMPAAGLVRGGAGQLGVGAADDLQHVAPGVLAVADERLTGHVVDLGAGPATVIADAAQGRVEVVDGERDVVRAEPPVLEALLRAAGLGLDELEQFAAEGI